MNTIDNQDFIKKTGSEINTFSIPPAAIKNGQLQLQWTQDTATLKRGVSLSEIWLVKKNKKWSIIFTEKQKLTNTELYVNLKLTLNLKESQKMNLSNLKLFFTYEQN